MRKIPYFLIEKPILIKGQPPTSTYSYNGLNTRNPKEEWSYNTGTLITSFSVIYCIFNHYSCKQFFLTLRYNNPIKIKIQNHKLVLLYIKRLKLVKNYFTIQKDFTVSEFCKFN